MTKFKKRAEKGNASIGSYRNNHLIIKIILKIKCKGRDKLSAFSLFQKTIRFM